MNIQKVDTIEVVGTDHDGRAVNHRGLSFGQELVMEHEKDNPYDPNAVLVLTKDGRQLGHLSKGFASAYAPAIDSGNYNFTVTAARAEYDPERPILIVRITAEELSRGEDPDGEDVERRVREFLADLYADYRRENDDYLGFINSESVDTAELIRALDRVRLTQRLCALSADIFAKYGIGTDDTEEDHKDDARAPFTKDELINTVGSLSADIGRALSDIKERISETQDIEDDEKYYEAERALRKKRKNFRALESLFSRYREALSSFTEIADMHGKTAAQKNPQGGTASGAVGVTETREGGGVTGAAAKARESGSVTQTSGTSALTPQTRPPEPKSVPHEPINPVTPGVAVLPVDLDEPRRYSFHKPYSFTFRGQKYFVKTWRDIYRKFLVLLYDDGKYHDIIRSLAGKSNFFVDGNHSGELIVPFRIGDDLYAEANLSSENILNRIKKLKDMLNIGDGELLIDYVAGGDDIRERTERSGGNTRTEGRFSEKAFLKWLESDGGVSRQTAKQYLSSIRACEKMYREIFGEEKKIFDAPSAEDIKETIEKLKNLPEFDEVNKFSNYNYTVYEVALDKFAKFAEDGGGTAAQGGEESARTDGGTAAVGGAAETQSGGESAAAESGNARKSGYDGGGAEVSDGGGADSEPVGGVTETQGGGESARTGRKSQPFTLRDTVIALLSSDDPEIRAKKLYNGGMTARTISTLIEQRYERKVDYTELLDMLRNDSAFTEPENRFFALAPGYGGESARYGGAVTSDEDGATSEPVGGVTEAQEGADSEPVGGAAETQEGATSEPVGVTETQSGGENAAAESGNARKSGYDGGGAVTSDEDGATSEPVGGVTEAQEGADSEPVGGAAETQGGGENARTDGGEKTRTRDLSGEAFVKWLESEGVLPYASRVYLKDIQISERKYRELFGEDAKLIDAASSEDIKNAIERLLGDGSFAEHIRTKPNFSKALEYFTRFAGVGSDTAASGAAAQSPQGGGENATAESGNARKSGYDGGGAVTSDEDGADSEPVGGVTETQGGGESATAESDNAWKSGYDGGGAVTSDEDGSDGDGGGEISLDGGDTDLGGLDDILRKLGIGTESGLSCSEALVRICEYAIDERPFEMATIDGLRLKLRGKDMFRRRPLSENGYSKLSNGMCVVTVYSESEFKAVVSNVLKCCHIGER